MCFKPRRFHTLEPLPPPPKKVPRSKEVEAVYHAAIRMPSSPARGPVPPGVTPLKSRQLVAPKVLLMSPHRAFF